MPLTRVRAATDGHLTAFAGVFPCKLLTDSSSRFDFERRGCSRAEFARALIDYGESDWQNLGSCGKLSPMGNKDARGREKKKPKQKKLKPQPFVQSPSRIERAPAPAPAPPSAPKPS